MSLPLKLSVWFAGTSDSKTGGSVSFGPPDGGTITAHPVVPNMPIRKNDIKIIEKNPVINFIRCT